MCVRVRVCVDYFLKERETNLVRNLQIEFTNEFFFLLIQPPAVRCASLSPFASPPAPNAQRTGWLDEEIK
jgi:hypothetical protein